MPSILVVEDDPAVRGLLTKWLRMEGHETAPASHGGEAVQMLGERKFSVVVTDLRMPVLDGMALLKSIARMPDPPATIMLTGYGDIESAVEAMKLGAADFLQKPLSFERLKESLDGVLAAAPSSTRHETSAALAPIQLLPEVQGLLLQLMDQGPVDSVVSALAAALDAREKATGSHSRRVSQLAVILGKAVGLGPAEICHLERGALLHDLGKIGISDRTLLKHGTLSETEWQEVWTHPEIGARIASQVEALRPAAELIRTHHERFDGSGYPRGLKGTEIPLAARIFAIADSMEVMITGRPYRAPRSFEEALAEIRRCSGAQFDPALVQRFCELPLSQWTWVFNGTEAA